MVGSGGELPGYIRGRAATNMLFAEVKLGMDNLRSRSLFERAQLLMPGGVNSPVRSFAAVGGIPRFIAHASGAYVDDVDGNTYLDFVGSWGPLILGHAHPSIVRAVQTTVVQGTSFGATTEAEVVLGELINQAIPSMEMIRLVNSGTEATMSAIRAARAFTGREKLIKFNGGYHGHSDGLLVRAGSGAVTHGVPTSDGVLEAVAAGTLVAEYNRPETVRELLEAYPEQVAAIIVEPVAGNMGVVPPQPQFLEGLRSLANSHGTLLIFDEVITGFRVAYGGAQALYGVNPDLTCLGKVIGAGLPIGAFGGRRDIMRLVSPLGAVYQAGTLSGNPLATAAGIACLRELARPGIYERLDYLGACLEQGLLRAASQVGLHLSVNRVGSLLTVFFTPGPVITWADVITADTSAYARFFHAMLDQGIYFPPSQFEALFVSTAHTLEDLERTSRLASVALAF